jgi:hypothetical protein
MASTHKHIRSSTVDKRPTTAIADGQIALNTNSTSPGLFFKDSTGATIIKVGPVHVGATAPNVSPAAGGSSGNSTGEVWLDNSLTPVGVKIWNGSAWVNATPAGSTTVQGLLELATDAETQTGVDTARAVTPASLQSKVSDSTSTTSSTTIASSTAVKSAYDLANAALPKSGGTITGNLEIGTTGSLSFEGATADGFETTIAVTDPTADRTITLPNVTGTLVTTGDTGTVTSTMIADGTIVSGDIASGTIVDSNISASAEIAVSKLADGAARQLLQTDSAGTGVEWTSNVDIPGTLDVTGATVFDSTAAHPLGTAGAPTITFTGDTNTGIYSPGADQVAISTNSTQRILIEDDGDININSGSFFFDNGFNRLGIGTVTPAYELEVTSNGEADIQIDSASTYDAALRFAENGTNAFTIYHDASDSALAIYDNQNTTERLRITSDGKLGLGTSSPGALLHLSATAGNQELRLSDTTNSAMGRMYVSNGTYLISETAHPLVFQTNATNRMSIDSSGRVGIGTTSPGSALEVNATAPVVTINSAAANASSIEFKQAGTLYGRVRFDGNNFDIGNLYSGGATIINAGNAERARIDSSGRLLVGTSSSVAVDSAGTTFNSELQVAGSSASVTIARSIGPGNLFLARNQTVNDGSPLGVIGFQGGDGTNLIQAASIQGVVDGTPGANDMPGRLVFSTTADGASSPTERMRINNAGRLMIGGTTATSGSQAVFFQVGESTDYCHIERSGPSSVIEIVTSVSTTAARNQYSFRNPNGVVGNIQTSGSSTSFITSSDYRLKENIIPLTCAISRVNQLQVHRFNFIADPNKTVDGFLAHEAQAVVPECVTGTKDEVDADGNPIYQGIDQSKLVPLLTAALQEALAEIESLKARVTALEP